MAEIEFMHFLRKHKDFVVKETPGATLFDIKGIVIEVKPQSKFTLTDHQIWCKSSNYVADTPFGICVIPDLQTIYDMKCATAECIPEWKHQYDRDLIEKTVTSVARNTNLYRDRLKETQDRIAKSDRVKYEFFHKNSLKETKIATIPEYIVHDRLHELVADLIGVTLPTYIRITSGDVAIKREQFDKLTHEQKIDLMMEESLVLALERWFIPQMVERGINHRLIPMFYNNNEAMPTYLLLKHVNIKGLIGEEDYIVQFGRDHFNEIEKRWIEAKQKIKDNGGFPQWFYDELFVLREKYRNGEKVGIHHG